MTAALEEQAQAVRATSSALSAWAADLTTARAGLALAHPPWLGAAADAATDALHELDADARVAEQTHARAVDLLLRCAADLEHAAQLQRRAESLAAEDDEQQSAAARARAVLRAATTIGPPLPPYAWDDSSPLRVASRRLAAEAEELAAAALRRTAAELDGLRPVRRGRRLRDQVTGFGRGAWSTLTDLVATTRLASPTYALLHPRSWFGEVVGFDRGLLDDVRHPRQALSALAGIDQLREGAYGEWLGGLVAGAVIPGGRAGRLEGLAGRTAIRLVDKGGPVRVRAGLRILAAYPAHIKDLDPARRRHILDGDETGGGHRAGTGTPTKTEFPASWSDDQIIDRVMQTAMRPEHVVPGRNGNLEARARFDGVSVKVVVGRDGRVITAHPDPGGPGVVRNPRAS